MKKSRRPLRVPGSVPVMPSRLWAVPRCAPIPLHLLSQHSRPMCRGGMVSEGMGKIYIVDENEYLSLLKLADEELLHTANGRGSKIKFNENHAWPGKLAVLLCESTVDELLEIQFMTERYYAHQINAAQNHTRQDELLALAYLRAVRLQFARNEPDMGFTQREFDFVLAAISQHLDSGAEEPKILEIGCGAGSLLASLAESGYRRL